jgi:hypothetical protein
MTQNRSVGLTLLCYTITLAMHFALTPSVVSLLLECRTVRASFLSSCRHLNPLCRALVVHSERFRALSPAYRLYNTWKPQVIHTVIHAQIGTMSKSVE